MGGQINSQFHGVAIPGGIIRKYYSNGAACCADPEGEGAVCGRQ